MSWSQLGLFVSVCGLFNVSILVGWGFGVGVFSSSRCGSLSVIVILWDFS